MDITVRSRRWLVMGPILLVGTFIFVAITALALNIVDREFRMFGENSSIDLLSDLPRWVLFWVVDGIHLVRFAVVILVVALSLLLSLWQSVVIGRAVVRHFRRQTILHEIEDGLHHTPTGEGV
jgi:hypothetical protein